MAAAARHRQLPAGGAFSGSGAQFVADFDQSYQAIEPAFTAASASSYVVRGGETLQSIALTVRGDAGLWYLIADANNLTGTETLAAGQALSIPNKVHNLHNTNDTFKPYDPNDAIGQTSATDPNQPAPKGNKNKCGIAQIFVAIIAVAVSVWTAGQSLSLLFGQTFLTASLPQLVVAGAIGGAAGSAASQGAAIALGVQDRFSWKQVGLSALAGGVGGAFGKIIPGSGFTVGAARGVASNVVTQGLAVATGLQDRFDWTAVAVAGVAGGVTSAFSRFLPGATHLDAAGKQVTASWTNTALSGVAGGIAGAGARSLITGTDFGDNLNAALPDIIGNTIGNSIAGGLAARSSAQNDESRGSAFGNALRAVGDFVGLDGTFGYQGPNPDGNGRTLNFGNFANAVGHEVADAGRYVGHEVAQAGRAVERGVEYVGDRLEAGVSRVYNDLRPASALAGDGVNSVPLASSGAGSQTAFGIYGGQIVKTAGSSDALSLLRNGGKRLGEAYDIYSKAEVATGIAEAAATLNWPADRPVAANIGNFEVKTEGKLFSGLDFNTNEPTLTGSVIDDSGKRIGFVETYDSGFTFRPTGEEPSYFKAPLPNATMCNSEDGLIYGRGNAYVQRMDKIGPAAAELFTSMLGSHSKAL